MDTKKLTRKLQKRFAELCGDLGFELQRVTTPCCGYAEMFAKRRHGLLLYVEWRDFCLDLYVVRLKDGEQWDGRWNSSYRDGTWKVVSVDRIYRSSQPPVPRCPFAWTEDQWEAYLYTVMDNYIGLIRNDPQVLLSFLDRIDESPERPPL